MSYKKISRQILKNNDIRPNKLLGQNFLRDKNVLRQIIVAANLTTSDTVLEVGPGEGILTEALARPAGRVVAVEKDKNLAARLKIKFANSKNVEIVEGDILKILKDLPFCKRGIEGDLKNAGKILPNPPFTKEGKTQYKVVANIPYYLTSHLIRLLLESANPPSDIVLMVQKEVAQRICACPPKMSLLSVSVQFYAEPKIIASVPKSAFWPQPKVDSAIIRITPRPLLFPERSPRPLRRRESEASERGDAVEGSVNSLRRAPLRGAYSGNKTNDNKNFFTVLHAGFSHPRKQLLNNLSSGLKIPRQRIGEFLQAAGLKPSQRAETLSVGDWIKLTGFIPH